MEKLCTSLRKEGNCFKCGLDWKEIKIEVYDNFCTKDDTDNCPTYQYYLQLYNKLTSKNK